MYRCLQTSKGVAGVRSQGMVPLPALYSIVRRTPCVIATVVNSYMTHTYALLEVSASTYDEIYSKLLTAGYEHAFDRGTIDMSGIGLVATVGPTVSHCVA